MSTNTTATTKATSTTSGPSVDSSPSETDRNRSIDLRLTDYPITIDNADLLEGLFYENDLDYEAIAAFVPEPVTVDDVRQRLRYEEVLKPWDDPHVLEACYNGLDMSTTEIADTVCDNQITSETVRARLHAFGILSEKSQKTLEEMDPGDIYESPLFDDDDPTYLQRGSNGGANA